jgi:hypothetical protein
MLDRLPAGLRHFILYLLPLLFAKVSTYFPNFHVTATERGAGGVALTAFLAWATPWLTRQYGVGKVLKTISTLAAKSPGV